MTNKIGFKDFGINPSVIAPEIYVGAKRQINQRGIEIAPEVKEELSKFLEDYIKFLGLNGKKTFFRIDAYFDNNRLYILDVNASFVDGWGNALNFTRAVGKELDNILLGEFPQNFTLLDPQYRPEFELCIKELGLATGKIYKEIGAQEIYNDYYRDDLYVYGNSAISRENLYPYNGISNDDKMNLAFFSKVWGGDLVKIPTFILPDEANFSQLPTEVALKVSNKLNIRSDGRNKLIIGKPKKAKDWQEKWENGLLVAQEIKKPMINNGLGNSQAIILTSGINAVVGYLQNSVRSIINDNSVQSPLIFN